ncbi:MAG: ArnT family glycosyltransferase [Candidatus Levyibacteriota bacterium]
MFAKRFLLILSLFSLNVILFFFFLISGSYPFFAIFLNILSVVILWFWIVPFKSIFHKKNKIIVDGIIVFCLFLLALFVYFYKIDIITPGIQGDELVIATTSEQVLSSSNFVPFLPVNLGHPTPLLYLTGLSIKTFGRTIMSIRLPYVVFGVLSIIAFYLLLRMFFQKRIAVAGALLMLFSYPFIILSRLAYEVTPEIFFQLVTLIFLYLVWKTKKIRYYVALALSLGGGLYTYIGFKTFALLLVVLVSYLILQSVSTSKSRLKYFLVFYATLFISLTPLLSYSIGHIQEITARASVLSPFNQGFSSTEVATELLSNVERLPRLFFMGDPSIGPNGDNNFKNNPSNVSMFDFGTFLLFIIGLFFLFRTNKKLFWVVLLLCLTALINDLFVIERIPEAMHPYGVGHPNTLRIAGIIPVIYFVIAYGINQIRLLFHKHELNVLSVIYFLFAVITVYNWYLYYLQPPDKQYSFYIVKNNGVFTLKAVDIVNSSKADKYGISPEIVSDNRFKYFLKRNVNVKIYAPKNYDDAVKEARENQITFFYVLNNFELAQQLLSQTPPSGLQIQPINLINDNRSLYAIVLVKTQ